MADRAESTFLVTKDRLNKIKQEKNLVTNKDDAFKIINTIHQ